MGNDLENGFSFHKELQETEEKGENATELKNREFAALRKTLWNRSTPTHAHTRKKNRRELFCFVAAQPCQAVVSPCVMTRKRKRVTSATAFISSGGVMEDK